MKEDIEEIFAKQIQALLGKRKFEFKAYIQTGQDNDGFKTEIVIPKTKVAITIQKKTLHETHSEADPDPRMFGDTEAVTANAMRDWYPGKINTWSTTTTTVAIKATGLPDIETHEETYEYTEHSYIDETKKAIKNILDLVKERYRETEREKEHQNKADQARQIRDAFAKIK